MIIKKGIIDQIKHSSTIMFFYFSVYYVVIYDYLKYWTRDLFRIIEYNLFTCPAKYKSQSRLSFISSNSFKHFPYFESWKLNITCQNKWKRNWYRISLSSKKYLLHFNTTKHCNNQFLPLVVVDRALRIIWT